jgi:hypothetical protein
MGVRKGRGYGNAELTPRRGDTRKWEGWRPRQPRVDQRLRHILEQNQC